MSGRFGFDSPAGRLSAQDGQRKQLSDIVEGADLIGVNDIQVEARGELRFLSNDPSIVFTAPLCGSSILFLYLHVSHYRTQANGKIYVDYGEGFHEQSAITIVYEEGETCVAALRKAKEIKYVRWDPDDVEGGTIRLRSVRFSVPTECELKEVGRWTDFTAEIEPRHLMKRRGQEQLVSKNAQTQSDARQRKFLISLRERQSPLLDFRWLSKFGLNAESSTEQILEVNATSSFIGSPLFDERWYNRQAKIKDSDFLSALEHYMFIGERSGLSPNPFFPVERYFKANSDVFDALRSGVLTSALEHFAAREAVEERSKSLYFDTKLYSSVSTLLFEERDASDFGLSPFLHYILVGWREGRRPNGVFDEDWYLSHCPGAVEAVAEQKYPNGFSHLLMSDQSVQAYASPFYDPKIYYSCNEDLRREVRRSSLDLFQHFCFSGRLEGRVSDHDNVADEILRYFPGHIPDARISSHGVSLRNALLETKTKAATESAAVAFWISAIPNLSIEHGKDVTLFEGQAGCFYISGVALLPYAVLSGIRIDDTETIEVKSLFTYPRVDSASLVSPMNKAGVNSETGFVATIAYSAKAGLCAARAYSTVFSFERNGEVREVKGPNLTISILAAPERSCSQSAVQVLMATYNPEQKAFRRQMETISSQNTSNVESKVSLVISDDASSPIGVREIVEATNIFQAEVDFSPHKMGFIANFERALLKRSDAAEVFLFSDQDDIWYPEKVAVLTNELRKDDTVCAYSDMRIVDGSGEVVSPTFWDVRSPHNSDAVSLGVANAVTGAASAFTRSLADKLAPFPRYIGLYHDQWLAVLAASLGEVRYVEKPLYDYVQHGTNVLGFRGSRGSECETWLSLSRTLRRARRLDGAAWTSREMGALQLAMERMPELLQRYVLLEEALRRVDRWHDHNAQTVASQVIAAVRGEQIDYKVLKAAWARLKRRSGGDKALLGIDYKFEAILTSLALLRKDSALAVALRSREREEKRLKRRHQARVVDQQMSEYEKKVAPFRVHNLSISANSPVRLNLFIPEINAATFFGGYYTKLALVLRLIDRGVPVRILLVDEPVVSESLIAGCAAAFPELTRAFAKADIIGVGARQTVDFTSHDALMATTWWSAHIANSVREALKQSSFLYLIQEYEPFTFELGTWYRGAELSYSLPHQGIYSTEILQNFFEKNKLGQFSPGHKPRHCDCLSIRNPIVGLGSIQRVSPNRRKRQVLFYARPQAHASRNMYDFGLVALRKAVSILGSKIDGWEFIGVGASEASTVSLGGNKVLRLVSKLDAYEYKHMLSKSDVGLALMYTPHPSLVPLEMASAGLLTVTNSCMTKTGEAMQALSPNLLVCKAETDIIASCIVDAVMRTIGGEQTPAYIDWPKSPSEAFPDTFIDRLIGLMKENVSGS